MYRQSVTMMIHQTRVRGMFQTGGETYRWFYKNVLGPLATQTRRAAPVRSGRLKRSLYFRIYGTNQNKLDIHSGATAEHANYYLYDTGTNGLIMPHSGNYLMLGSEFARGIPVGGPTNTGGIMRKDAVHGYRGNNFIEDTAVDVLRKRRLL